MSEGIDVLEVIQLIAICQTNKIEHFEVWKKLQFLVESLYQTEFEELPKDLSPQKIIDAKYSDISVMNKKLLVSFSIDLSEKGIPSCLASS